MKYIYNSASHKNKSWLHKLILLSNCRAPHKNKCWHHPFLLSWILPYYCYPSALCHRESAASFLGLGDWLQPQVFLPPKSKSLQSSNPHGSHGILLWDCGGPVDSTRSEEIFEHSLPYEMHFNCLFIYILSIYTLTFLWAFVHEKLCSAITVFTSLSSGW